MDYNRYGYGYCDGDDSLSAKFEGLYLGDSPYRPQTAATKTYAKKKTQKYVSYGKEEAKYKYHDGYQEDDSDESQIAEAVFNPETYSKDEGITSMVAIDCEMVGVNYTESGLARISIVNYDGHVLMDTYVKPEGKITNYRSWVSGVYPSDLKYAMGFKKARAQAIAILKGRDIIGHSLHNDFKALQWRPKKYNIKDISLIKEFRHPGTNQPRSLKKLTLEFLGKKIQSGSHDSVDDARAALGCYRVHQSQQSTRKKKYHYY
ncbi:unnamed protein product [Moneuplotes crassus]|uniref:RNA exonuclease 4 n=1 Tax=Euplotes crassus TaxID=5936 RepID=A0AAD1XEX0_EUPCR|nr:unnamed protein product [Moneuplotes crassus]